MLNDEHQGWIMLYRQLLGTAIWGNRDLVCLWIYCLLKANHKEAWVNMKGHATPIKVMPGQFITGQHALHRGLCGDVSEPSSRTVWRWLHALKDLEMLAVDTTVSNRFSIITLCNWKTYQAAGIEDCQGHVESVSSGCQADVKGVSTNKKAKKAKKANNVKDNTNSAVEDTAFDVLWKAWPGKKGGGKEKLRKKWKLDKLDSKAEHVMAVVAAKKTTEQWTKDNGQYIPMLSTFLNQQRWDCDIADITAAPTRKTVEEIVADGENART